MTLKYISMSGLIDNQKLYSTVRVSLMDDAASNVVKEALYDRAACYCNDIAQAMRNFQTKKYPTRDLMRYFELPDKMIETAIKRKVISALPTVHAEGDTLYAALKLIMVKDLTEGELIAFTEQIQSQYENGWGEEFEQINITTSNSDVISLRLSHQDMQFFTGAAFDKTMERNRAQEIFEHTPEGR